MKKIELEVVALSHSMRESQSFAVVLGEKDGDRRLPILIGAYEAQAIAVAMEKMNPPRPLTHDVTHNICQEFKIELREIVVNNLLDGIFFATLVCENEGDVQEIDSRTSDALALALRFGSPIYTYEFILDKAGIVMQDSGRERKRKEEKTSNELRKHSLDKLNTMLNEALEKEDYEKAARLRDEITNRESAA